MVKLLLAHAAIKLNHASTANGSTALYIACQRGHAGVVKLLLAQEGIKVNKAKEGGVTPFHTACSRGKTEVVKVLLGQPNLKVDLARTDTLVTPLYVVCSKEGLEDVLRLLLADGRAGVNNPGNRSRSTPLHGAVMSKSLLKVQLLVLHGASLTAGNIAGKTAAQFAARHSGRRALAEWLGAVAGWPRLRIAAGCRLHKDAAAALRLGRIDPEDPTTAFLEDVAEAILTSNANPVLTPAALPWGNAPPICKATIKLVADATRGWHRTTHWLHHKAVRDAVFAVVVVAGRLQQRGGPLSEAAALPPAPDPAASAPPALPIEIWLYAMGFALRSWWEVPRALHSAGRGGTHDNHDSSSSSDDSDFDPAGADDDDDEDDDDSSATDSDDDGDDTSSSDDSDFAIDAHGGQFRGDFDDHGDGDGSGDEGWW